MLLLRRSFYRSGMKFDGPFRKLIEDRGKLLEAFFGLKDEEFEVSKYEFWLKWIDSTNLQWKIKLFFTPSYDGSE